MLEPEVLFNHLDHAVSSLCQFICIGLWNAIDVAASLFSCLPRLSSSPSSPPAPLPTRSRTLSSLLHMHRLPVSMWAHGLSEHFKGFLVSPWNIHLEDFRAHSQLTLSPLLISKAGVLPPTLNWVSLSPLAAKPQVFAPSHNLLI